MFTFTVVILKTMGSMFLTIKLPVAEGSRFTLTSSRICGILLLFLIVPVREDNAFYLLWSIMKSNLWYPDDNILCLTQKIHVMKKTYYINLVTEIVYVSIVFLVYWGIGFKASRFHIPFIPSFSFCTRSCKQHIWSPSFAIFRRVNSRAALSEMNKLLSMLLCRSFVASLIDKNFSC